MLSCPFANGQISSPLLPVPAPVAIFGRDLDYLQLIAVKAATHEMLNIYLSSYLSLRPRLCQESVQPRNPGQRINGQFADVIEGHRFMPRSGSGSLFSVLVI